jgi:hypothetical protein
MGGNADLAVDCAVDKACPTYTPDENLTLLYVFDVKALYLEWKVYLALL